PVRRRATTWWHVHVDEGVLSRGVLAGDEDRVGVADEPDMRAALVMIRRGAARNREALVRAATAAVHRKGPSVSMATIAADAGVGIGTLYRHFPTREDLLNLLAHRSFEQVLANAEAAESNAATAAEALRHFIESAISQRNELVLPLHGGPRPASDSTRVLREQVHQIIQQIIDRGRAD